MDLDIGQRLKLYRENANISMTEISLDTGISRDNLYKWERGSKPSNINDYLVLKRYLDTKENVHTAELEIIPNYIRNKSSIILIPFEADQLIVEQHKFNVAAGSIVMFNERLHLAAYRIEAPFLGDMDGIVEVVEDSMEPAIRYGCRVAIARLKHKNLLIWGNYYYTIDTNMDGVVRRVYPLNEEGIKLVADHSDQVKHPPVSRSWEDILAIFKVKAVIERL